MSHSKKKTVALLLGLLFTLLLFIPKQNAAASTKAANENIQWDPITKTVTISGHVKDTEIINDRMADGGWSKDVEYVVFIPGTELEITTFASSKAVTLFGYLGPGVIPEGSVCSQLKSVVCNDIAIHSNVPQFPDKSMVANWFSECEKVNVFSTANPEIYPLGSSNVDVILYYASIAASSYNLCGFTNAWLADSGHYSSFDLVSAAPNLTTLSITPNYCARFASDSNTAKDVPQGNWQCYINGDKFGPLVNGYAQWKDVCDSADQNAILRFVKMEDGAETAVVFDANGGYFGNETVGRVDQTQPVLTDLIVPENAVNGDKYLWGYAYSPNATEPEVVPGANNAKAGLCSNYLYAVWRDTPAPGPSEDGWHQSDAGWQYMVDGEYVTGWLWIDDTYGAHWYYFNEDTYMAASQWQWDEENSSWYWLCSSGPMIQGLWQWIDNEWYGFWWNGKMCRGWVWDNAWQAWFYCYNNGIMARNAWEGPYWLNWEGIWIR